MSALVARLDRAFYPDQKDNWDDTLFREWILARLSPDATILDVGAGAGIVAQMNFRGMVGHVAGVDLDERVLDNPFLDEGRVGDGATLPYEDSRFDLVFADNVAEHLDDPEAVFREIARVLKPGGRFLFKTPNRSHYVPLIARLTPHGFHRMVNRWRGRAGEDTFPTRYRANSKRQVRDIAEVTGFRVERIECIEGRPEYLRINALTYLAGIAYERMVNASGLFAPLRVLLVVELLKP